MSDARPFAYCHAKRTISGSDWVFTVLRRDPSVTEEQLDAITAELLRRINGERGAMKRIKPTKILLEGGTSDTDRKFLAIAPTPRTITHEGRKYFRCPNSMAQDPSDNQ